MKKKSKFSKVSYGFMRNRKTGETYNHYVFANYPDSERIARAHIYTTHGEWINACRLAVADYNIYIECVKAANLLKECRHAN